MKVGMVQISNSFSGANYLPYSVGILQAYAQQYLMDSKMCEFLTPVYKRIPVADAVRALLKADVAAFSVYVWSRNISIEIARKLKEVKPEIIIVFGGPQVPDRSEQFLRAYPFVDIVCHGEGERVFAQVLESGLARNWKDIPSVSFIENGRYFRNSQMPRLVDLSAVPSPYLTGIFDRLMGEYQGEQWLGLWETNRGCPFSCAFCDWGSATASKIRKFDMQTLTRELEWFARHRIEFIFCCDANFGILKRDVEIAKMVADTKARYGCPKVLSVQNSKNAEERVFRAQKILADAGLSKGVTLAFQSLDPVTLESVKRGNINLEDFRSLQARFTRAGIATYGDVLLALPGETYESFANGVSDAIEHGQHNRIQFGNLTILPNAEIGDPGYQEKFGLITVKTKAVIFHGMIDDSPDCIDETEELVVGTDAMPTEEWVRARVFCWMTSLLHFDKIFQIPLIILRLSTGLSYRKLIEVFTGGLLGDFPVISSIRSFFTEKARSIQKGEMEYCPAREWLNIYWPVDEFIFIKLCRERLLGRFYNEAGLLLRRFLGQKFTEELRVFLDGAIRLNSGLIKLPFQTDDLVIECSFNIPEVYLSVLRAEEIPFKKGTYAYRIDRTSEFWRSWDDWLREVVWYGNKRGAYLYRGCFQERCIEGHC